MAVAMHVKITDWRPVLCVSVIAHVRVGPTRERESGGGKERRNTIPILCPYSPFLLSRLENNVGGKHLAGKRPGDGELDGKRLDQKVLTAWFGVEPPWRCLALSRVAWKSLLTFPAPVYLQPPQTLPTPYLSASC